MFHVDLNEPLKSCFLKRGFDMWDTQICWTGRQTKLSKSVRPLDIFSINKTKGWKLRNLSLATWNPLNP